ncbi:hypothetical protein ES711_07430 [Gelidibacter salicanalis]|uniref:Uncharacterized protein n=1 Tax=Gelidibacter salicanalis TaxID=291193 RepID=A0A5C7AHV8_9FLAO|nr:hypothetical protein [Gelidibacter salicanalis]TXE08330.1 hypothetical protein ES711_07430 [Gelidibacter salicanalis]
MTVQNKKVKTTILAVLMTAVHAIAQVEKLPQPHERSGPPPPGFPIDDGLIFLVAAALIFGIYKILKYSKKQV